MTDLRRPVRLVAFVAAVAMAVAACGDDTDVSPPTQVLPAPTTAEDPATDADPEGDDPDGPAAPEGSDGDGSDGADGAGRPDATGVDSLAGAAVQLRLVAELDRPIAVVSRPGSPDLWVAERPGRVRTIRFVAGDAGTVTAEVGPVEFDLSDRTSVDAERGLLSIAFAPDGDTLVLSSTDRSGDTVIEAVSVVGDGIDPASRRLLLTVEQPFANHNGGHVAFGPDGALYVGLGDGGGAGDPLDVGQDPNDPLGTILRVWPRPDGGVDVPPDNPFVAGGGAPEVWVWGLRNPWRFSFDRATGDLWVADVGQNAVEEVTRLPVDPDGTAGRGANLGWPILEGDRPYSGDPVPPGLVDPIVTYGHDEGCSITGGVVSRGVGLPALRGAYLYADYCDAELRAALVIGGRLAEDRRLGVTVPGGQVVSFGEGPDGEIYVVSLAGGVYRIDPA